MGCFQGHVVTRTDGYRLKEGKFILDIRNKFTVRVVRNWNRLPRVMDAPCLEGL